MNRKLANKRAERNLGGLKSLFWQSKAKIGLFCGISSVKIFGEVMDTAGWKRVGCLVHYIFCVDFLYNTCYLKTNEEEGKNEKLYYLSCENEAFVSMKL